MSHLTVTIGNYGLISLPNGKILLTNIKTGEQLETTPEVFDAYLAQFFTKEF